WPTISKRGIESRAKLEQRVGNELQREHAFDLNHRRTGGPRVAVETCEANTATWPKLDLVRQIESVADSRHEAVGDGRTGRCEGKPGRTTKRQPVNDEV